MANTPCKQGKSISADFYIAWEWGVGIPDLSPFLVRFSMSLNLIAAHLSTKKQLHKVSIKASNSWPPNPSILKTKATNLPQLHQTSLKDFHQFLQLPRDEGTQF